MKRTNLLIIFFVCIILLVTGCSSPMEKAPKEPWSGLIMVDLSDEEVYKLLGRISLEIKKDRDYENNLNTIIEKSFKDCGIENSFLIDKAKFNLKITVSDSK